LRRFTFHRLQAGLNQTDFGSLCGLRQHQISDLEMGRRPTDEERRELERAFGVPVEELLAEIPEDVVPPPPSMALAIRTMQMRRRR
jgi:transcriptional regulator with XRE-family HTH domain